ncbi:FecCD family ABC transporter permease [Corynebacterium timonense]|uniref:Iron complex transport system permease protein n=1 Tax=Corynebacterium timonense TaxID=441500 RepID=A0A1H1LC58_9CORY|nr:iron complex transport system permease protein [Corynebacterium timonense]
MVKPVEAAPKRPRLALAFLVAGTGFTAVALLAIAIGPVTLNPGEAFAALRDATLDDHSSPAASVVYNIRLPRIIVGALVGAALAVSGAVMQAVFRNPLADPGIIGVSAGAATAAVLAIVFGLTAVGAWVLPAAAFIGALGTVAVVQSIAQWRGGGPVTLVLVGIAASAFLGAVTSAAVANAPQDSDIRGIAFWLNGDLVARTWAHVGIAAAPILFGTIAVIAVGRDLNILTLGDSTARSLGVNTAVMRPAVLSLAALLAACAVAVSGIIGFVGLVVPHLVRLTVGTDHRALLPLAAVAGATFVVAADTLARTIFDPVVLQTGSVVAFIGSPLFLWLLLRTIGPNGRGAL